MSLLSRIVGSTSKNFVSAGLSFALVLVFTSAATRAQTPEIQQIFEDVVDVRVVNIEVVVSDKQGNRVSGLKRADFLLKIDGKETPIDYFSEIQDGQASSTADGSQAIPSITPGKEVPTNYLVFIDDYFAIARDRDRVIDSVERQLSQLRQGDKVAVVAFDGKKLDMLSSWTEFPAEIERVFRRAKQRKAFGLKQRTALRTNDHDRRSLHDMRAVSIERTGIEDPSAGRFLGTHLDPSERGFAQRLTTDVERSVMAAVSTLRSFANPPGRKVMLILDGGWPFSPAEYTVNDFTAAPEAASAAGATDTTYKSGDALFGDLTDTANLLGYTLYPVDVQGMYRDGFEDASNSAEVQFSGAAGQTASPVRALARENSIHAALHFLADETGGEALINADRDDALSRVIEDTRSYYWLGFQPDRREDDQQHDIEIQIVGRKDLRARFRENFMDLSRGTQITMMVESSLMLGDPPSTRPLATSFGRPKKSARKVLLPLEARIPMAEIQLLETNGRFVNELEIRITVMDEEGNRSETTVEKIAIDGSEPPKPDQFFIYQTELTLRKRNHRIVVAVFDPLSGTILSSTGEIALK